MIHDNSRIYGNAEIYNQCYVAGNAIVYGNSKLHNNCIILHFSKIFDNSKLYNVAVCNYSNIFGDAILVGRFRICYKSYIGGTTIINCNKTYIRLKNIIINQGCWCDIIEENGKTYLISNTLVKKRVIENEEV
jgi:UDP-3-O-[3-hydroxymyristoyl] glucosamine N-acyltransferase